MSDFEKVVRIDIFKIDTLIILYCKIGILIKWNGLKDRVIKLKENFVITYLTIFITKNSINE